MRADAKVIKMLDRYELEKEWRKLINEGAVQALISTELEWSNENTLKLYTILKKANLEHFILDKRILHPTKDIGPPHHVPKYHIRVVAKIFDVESLLKQIQKLNENTEITKIKSGMLTFIADDGVTYLLKEEEP